MPKQNEVNEDENNTIKIAGKGFEIYNQAILNKLQRFDQLVICALDCHLEKACHIIRQWEAVGIVPLKNRLVFEKREEDLEFSDGNKEKKFVNRITLTKQPEQFRFTKT